MAIQLNDNLNISAPKPIDTRIVQNTTSDMYNIAPSVLYIGLEVFILADFSKWFWTGVTWSSFSSAITSVYTSADKNMIAISASGDGQLATNNTITYTPVNGCYVSVFLNGVEYDVGDGVTISCSFYFSNNGGASGKGFSSSNPNGKVQSGDSLYFNSSVLGTSIVNGWRISLSYLV